MRGSGVGEDVPRLASQGQEKLVQLRPTPLSLLIQRERRPSLATDERSPVMIGPVEMLIVAGLTGAVTYVLLVRRKR